MEFTLIFKEYVGSSTLFYFSECNDTLYTSGANSVSKSDIGIINFNYNAVVSNKSKPTRGVDLSLVKASQEAIVNPGEVNAYIPTSTINPSVNYLSPTFFTAQDKTEWLI